MPSRSIEEMLARLRKVARRVTVEEQIQAGLEALEATGLPLEEVESLARGVGLDLEEVAYSLGSSNGSRTVYHPIIVESDVIRMLIELHDVLVRRQASRLASVSQTERDLYDVADENEPLGAAELCRRTGIHYVGSPTKQCLSNLVKLGLLRKVKGKRGYLRTPTKVMT